MKILVTGGAGFIGGNFVHHMVNKYPDGNDLHSHHPDKARQAKESADRISVTIWCGR